MKLIIFYVDSLSWKVPEILTNRANSTPDKKGHRWDRRLYVHSNILNFVNVIPELMEHVVG